MTTTTAAAKLRTLGRWAERPQAVPWCCGGCPASTPARGPYWTGPIYPHRRRRDGRRRRDRPGGQGAALREFFARSLVTNTEAGGVSPFGPMGQAPRPGRAMAETGGYYQTQFCATCVGEILRSPGSPLTPPEPMAELEREAERLVQEIEAEARLAGDVSMVEAIEAARAELERAAARPLCAEASVRVRRATRRLRRKPA
jgi:hypothetical protein